MKTILIVTNLYIVFSLASADESYFVTVFTSSMDIRKKFDTSLMYYNVSASMDPIRKWSNERKIEKCIKIFAYSRFFVTNDDYEKYENILQKVKEAGKTFVDFSAEPTYRHIFIKYTSFEIINLSTFIYTCYLTKDIELYISTDFTNTNNFFLYTYVPGSSDMSESSRVTLLGYAELNPQRDFRTKYGLELLYFTQRNVFDVNNNFIERDPEPWYPDSVRLCAAGYESIASNYDFSIEICKVIIFDVHTHQIEITSTQPKRRYKVPTLLCQIHNMDTNKIVNYYLTPDLDNNSSVFYLSTNENSRLLSIEARICGVP